ncbi:family 1 purine phosphorylase [Hyaloraphidium curvatum]|nr:family 1 purine phosphorylase [Hyaloraphidium curvatum]
MEPNEIPLLEFDPSPIAVINAASKHGTAPLPVAFPRHAVLCWFGDVVAKRTSSLERVYAVPFEHGEHPIHIVEHRGKEVALVSAGVGAPASVMTFECVHALGATKIVGCGGAGIVRPGFDPGHVIVPVEAIRDEGTSYHYVPAGERVFPDPKALEAIDATLSEHGVPHDRGLTWTTDGFYRETPAKVARRREQGCIAVEMEAAALFAAAKFRGVQYAQFLYAGDDVSAEEWDPRGWDSLHSVRERLLDLALDAVLRI